ncbi:MAG: archaeosine synthase subunit alpha [Candidatus Wukongarchaeota archaeon]|nr:archaeosine synthase subunit alpha [Candidatus Wukongarchaeota archaeon]
MSSQDFYFEAHKLDGLARIGKIYLNRNSFLTPCIAHPSIFENLWRVGDDSENPLKVLIPQNFRSSSPALIKTEKNSDLLYTIPSLNFEGDVVNLLNLVKNLICEKKLFDAQDLAFPVPCNLEPSKISYLLKEAVKLGLRYFILQRVSSLLKNPRKMIDIMVGVIKNICTPDSVLHLSSFIPPYFMRFLSYLGVDIFDDSVAYIAASQKNYLTFSKVLDFKGLKELPCPCTHCENFDLNADFKHSREEIFEFLLAHNLSVYKSEIRSIREDIRGEVFRESVEAITHASPSIKGALRILDRDSNYSSQVEEAIPVRRKSVFLCSSSDSLYRPMVKRWRKRIIERCKPPKHVKIVVILPCSARKPYSFSKSHKFFLRSIKGGARKKIKMVHEIILTSPLGVVPRELELTYPASKYEIPVTGHWDWEEKKTVTEVMGNYLSNFGEDVHFLAHVDGVYAEIVREASDYLSRDVEFTCLNGESPKAEGSLKRLKSAVYEALKDRNNAVSNPNLFHIGRGRMIADFQFGSGVGNILLPPSMRIKVEGNYPRIQRFFINNAQVATLVPEDGLLALTFLGGEKLVEKGFYFVEFDGNKIEGGTLYCVAVSEADTQIRPQDEVFIVNKDRRILAVGKAVLSGKQMVMAKKGPAVRIRRKNKQDGT